MFTYKKYIIIILVILFAASLYSQENHSQENQSQENKDIQYHKKDPFIAGLMSAFMMGLGQFYTKDYLSGSMFVLNDFIQKGMLILLVANFSDKYTDEEEKMVRWQKINTVDKVIAISFAAYYFGTRLYCIIDAIDSAEKYNKNLEKEFTENNVKFNYLANKDFLSVSLSKKF